jgi:pimeloyl-ACP methyl ester carboxylesterase
MNDNTLSHRLHLNITILIVVFVGSLGLLRAAETPLKPLYPGIMPACACESLTNLSLPNTTIESAVVDVSNRMCRVTAIVTHPPTKDRVTVWIGLPLTNWNGRFEGTGGGGFLGGHPNSLRGPVRQGFSAGATDTGHEGGSGKFALDSNGRQDWPAIIDNAYLGIHEMTVVGKALTAAFYGRAPRYSYFVGGSTGGRQGLMEAQRFPDDYDGIVSACPAINWHRFVSASLWPQVVMLEMKNFVSKAKLDAATAAAIAACDTNDDVKDGVIDDPFHCAYDPKALVGTKVGDDTFTEADAVVIRKIWEGPRTQEGRFMWYGLERGADMFPYAGTSASGTGGLNGKPFSIALEYWLYYLAQGAKWDWSTLTYAGFEQFWTKSVEQYGAVIGTDDPDLTRFRDRGSKVIIYHGLADELIPAAGSIDYYKRVQQRVGGAKATAKFARLFLVPGVNHGFNGPGARPAGVNEAIIRWVEEGKAPDKLIAEKRDASGKVIRTRPLFPYPQAAKYKGSGSTDEEKNFRSKEN